MKNKKILLICREAFSYPLFFLAKKLISNENEVAAFFIHPEESYLNKCLYNANTYYNFKSNLTDVKLYDLKHLCSEFDKKLQKSIIDLEYLEYVESKYCHFKNLNLQLLSSQLTSRHFHSRFYFNNTSFEQSLIFLELGYKRVEFVLDDFKPDVILDIEDAELLRTILNEVAFQKKIPYINIDYPRVEEFKIPTYCLGLVKDKNLELEYNRFISIPESELQEEISYVMTFRRNSKIMSLEFNGTITSQYNPDSFVHALKTLFGMALYFLNVLITSGNWRIIKTDQILFTNPLKHFLFYLMVAAKRQYLFRKNKYFDPPDDADSYVYMPLHLIPESTTFVKTPFYINELSLIEQISKSLPIGWKLYVKEHQAMVGERNLSFYKAVKKFPNVKLVKFNYYNDPKPWINNSKGVITISGTTAYEAAMLGKKSIVFADVPFSLIEGVFVVNSFEMLPKLIASFGHIENLKSCASYLAAVKSVSLAINLKYLTSEAELIIKGEKAITKKFKSNIDILFNFFDNAFAKFRNNS